MRKILLQTIISLFVLLLFASNSAQASDRDLTFTGSGWGHGVGLSQYGAHGMALEGKGYQEILAHYFSGTQRTNYESLKNESNLFQSERPLMVGLLQNQPELVFRIEKGSAKMCFEEANLCVGTGYEGEQWKVSRNENGSCYFQRQAGVGGGYIWFEPSGSCDLSIRPDSESTVLYVPLKGRSYNNALLMGKVSPISGTLNLSLKIGIEEYVNGVQELPDTWHKEVLKAQAVASRTFAVSELL